MRLSLGDTLHLEGAVTDSDGQPVDLTGASVAVRFTGTTAYDGDAVITDAAGGLVSYSVVADVAGNFQARWVVTLATGDVSTTWGPSVQVVDPDAAWASVADVEAIIGPQDDPEAVMVALDLAQALILSWLCAEVPTPLPPEFVFATALIAARLIKAPTATDPIAETIGDYSYRMAGPPDPTALRNEIRHLLAPWLCSSAQSVRVWPGPEEFVVEDCGEFQVDAEGFLRS